MARFNTFQFNKKRYNQGGPSFFSVLDDQFDVKPVVKIEFMTIGGVATDITDHYISGGTVERIKERAPDEIQAGDFDVELKNHDDMFSEFVATSLIYGIQYHGARIRVWAGFELSDGSVELQLQQVGYIDELVAHDSDSNVTIRCRDLIRSLLDGNLHPRPTSEVPVVGGSNIGDGTCSDISTRAFKTKNESWTLTCTLGGDDAVATFSVVGSVSGSVGTATSGTEFSTGTGAGGIKFTIRAGTVDWVAGDVFTFDTKQYPEWSLVNPAKIIWSILTGYNWDTDTVEAWAGQVLGFDHTQSDANTELDYQTFVDVISQFASADYITGRVPYDTPAAEFIQGILVIFLGALYTGGDGRIRIQSFQPIFTYSPRNYADSKKIMRLGYNRSVNEIINTVVVEFKRTDSWEFSDQDVVLDGVFSSQDTDSVAAYGLFQLNGAAWEMPWYSGSGGHAEDFAERLIIKYADPPLVIDFETGADGIISQIGDRITVTDEKYNFTELNCEISRITKNLDAVPLTIGMTARRDGDLDLTYGFLGSRVDEGDGLSPQATTYGASSDTDKLFCYLTDNYRMF